MTIGFLDDCGGIVVFLVFLQETQFSYRNPFVHFGSSLWDDAEMSELAGGTDSAPVEGSKAATCLRAPKADAPAAVGSPNVAASFARSHSIRGWLVSQYG